MSSVTIVGPNSPCVNKEARLESEVGASVQLGRSEKHLLRHRLAIPYRAPRKFTCQFQEHSASWPSSCWCEGYVFAIFICPWRSTAVLEITSRSTKKLGTIPERRYQIWARSSNTHVGCRVFATRRGWARTKSCKASQQLISRERSKVWKGSKEFARHVGGLQDQHRTETRIWWLIIWRKQLQKSNISQVSHVGLFTCLRRSALSSWLTTSQWRRSTDGNGNHLVIYALVTPRITHRILYDLLNVGEPSHLE